MDEFRWDGLSPRVRGNPPQRAQTAVKAILAVYPRACGETRRRAQTAVKACGLSPRVRGNLTTSASCSMLPRSIPARAGEPRSVKSSKRVMEVYPRACGGTETYIECVTDEHGLSPRVRGNHCSVPTPLTSVGSIPARTGEPANRRAAPSPGVYPRACGGTGANTSSTRSRSGLSPRVRGNLQASETRPARLRSIPARAGEPCAVLFNQQRLGVYPRACGGTAECWPAAGRGRGSIPARAGEPGDAGRNRGIAEVYPRACGGT